MRLPGKLLISIHTRESGAWRDVASPNKLGRAARSETQTPKGRGRTRVWQMWVGMDDGGECRESLLDREVLGR